jgi:hypothetical protein
LILPEKISETFIQKMLLKIIIIIILFHIRKMHNSKCPAFHHHYENRQQETISKFTDFKQLNFKNCNLYLNITDLRLRPEINLMLNNSLNFSGLNICSLKSFFSIHFSNIYGIDVESNIRDDLKFTNINNNNNNQFDYKYLMWHFELSNFHFYFKNKIINNETCTYELFKQTNGFLSQIHFLIMESDVTYSDQICPLVFHNSIIQTLSIKMVSSSFIFNNKFAFIKDIPLHLFDYPFNSNILQLKISLYHYDLDLKLLNEHVFESIMDLDIDGIIKSIQDDLFKSFTNLKQLRFRTQNVKGLFAFKNKWLNYLNINVINKKEFKINDQDIFNLVLFQMFSNVTYYEYPNVDFCYFKDFPHQRLVLPQLRPSYKTKLTCTELFLVQYSIKYEYHLNQLSDLLLSSYSYSQYYIDDVIEDTFLYYKVASINELIEKCNFTKRLKLCNITTISIINNEVDLDHWYMIDWKVLSKYSYISFIFYINPILSLLSILISILNVIILTSKHLKKEVKCLYYYFNIHLITNILFISAQYLDLLTECTYEDYFCSLFESSIYLQYFKIFGLKLIKNSLTTFSNVSYTSFILIRYTKITSSKNVTLKYFEKLKLKYFILISIPFSVLINVYICFAYSTQFIDLYLTEVNSRIPFDYFKINISKNENIILNIFQYFKIIISDLFFYIMSIVFDIYLVLFIKKSITTVRTASMIIGINNKNTEKKQASKRRLTTMIILNGCNFFMFRLPLALIDIYGLIISISISQIKNSLEYTPNLSFFIVCRYFKFCESLQKLFYSFYALSFIIQFYIFYKLDTNFKESYKKIF